jgi:1-acyl-sn-glycerol-3-phosphate acyltransferase
VRPTEVMVNTVFRWLTGMAFRVHGQDLSKVPSQGPLIIAANHVNSLEVPIVFTRLRPRPVTGFAKAETWDNPVLRPLFDLWGAIPLERGEADMGAIRSALKALSNNQILAVAPEGTRSASGQLGRGKPGIVTVALHTNSPILPLVYYGHQNYIENVRKLRRTDFFVKVGQPFRLTAGEVKVDSQLRQKMVDEIMYRLAELLPPEYRGFYQDLSMASQEHIQLL